MHEVTEGPHTVATVCATIEIARGSLQMNTSVLIKTSLSGEPNTGDDNNDYW